MTLPTVIRIFFAIDLPVSMKEELGRFISQLKKKSRSHAIRWSRPENLHVTLQFLAEVKAEHVPQLIEQVKMEIEGQIPAITLQLGKLTLFPSPYRPRVIVLDLMPQEELAMLSGLIGHGIRACEYETESRPFRGHLTLGRIKHTHGVHLEFLNEVEKPSLSAPVEEVVLFRSQPQPEGSMYTVIERLSLGRPSKNVRYKDAV